ncbi:MAG TPA: UDP-N-acetylmuramoylalanyl-D-glutamyl-2,6-diaminopimelate--D-alanyl-D-alanine ligase [Alphaproteobacteria bacterium]|nr:UDP-N-acetylmuramoylalanyl-D-glutamyl-2,6-diaminopimelate--D-alanyl-D-alanine ligase [Alphaproteobacteria bacterium]
MAERALWTASEAEAATGGTAHGDWTAGGISIDTRTLAKDDLYIAIKGERLDGHDFVEAAFEAGAAAALVAMDRAEAWPGRPLLVVADTFESLNALGAAARQRTAARIVAITGSVGKTSTKEALRFVLERQGPTAASAGNLNNHWGVPLSLARMPADTGYGIFELGMNAPGEIGPLSRLVQPHVAIITTIAPAHTEFFPSLGAVADAKAEIFEGLNGGIAILNRDNAFFPQLAVAAQATGVGRIVGFGAHPDAAARLVDAKLDGDGSTVTARFNGRELQYRVGQPGRHLVINSLAVLAAAEALGADLGRAAADLAEVPASKGRGERVSVAVDGGEIVIIDDSYNASPASMRAAFETLSQIRPEAGGRRLAALGDMLELGERSAELHAGLADSLRENGIELVFTAGSQMAHLHNALPEGQRGAHAADSKALAPLLCDAVRAGDVVTVKGSLGSAMARVVDALRSLEKAPTRAVNG